MPSTDSPGNGWHDEDAPRIDISTFGEMPGSRTLPRIVPGPDPERDKRIEVYRDRERRRAARALDRWFETNFPIGGNTTVAVAGERFVEAVGDYVLARLGDTDLNARVVYETCFNPEDHGPHVSRGADDV